MIRLMGKKTCLLGGRVLLEEHELGDTLLVQARLVEAGLSPQLPLTTGSGGHMAGEVLAAHHEGVDAGQLRMRFDALASHDITYVGIIQTAMASGLREFPVPFVLTNCHNSLCAVGGTINEDDHLFGLSAARRFGGEYVPAHVAVIHQYMREMHAGCGRMILGSDSHTRYGALGTLAVGEGGPELVKQLVGRTYDVPYPDVVGVYLTGAPVPGVGPQDVALAIIKAVFDNGFVKNSVMEFVGPGVDALSVDFRLGVDVMTTETACWSSLWRTDAKVREYLALHGRPEAFRELNPASVAWYDRVIVVDLSAVRPLIALPFHPSNVFTIDEVNANASDMLATVAAAAHAQTGGRVPYRLDTKLAGGRLKVEQGIIAGCSGGGFENIMAATRLLGGQSTGDGAFALSVYPASQPVNMALARNGALADLMAAGAIIRTAFCGPCFGAGDTPACGALSLRHTTRNFPNREGSKPGDGQMAAVALMDARSIAATAANQGRLTPATELADRLAESPVSEPYSFDGSVYTRRVYRGFGRPRSDESLVFGPNIKPWPVIAPLPENQLLLVASVITDPVTTTDELIPSGETSSLRSNPLKLAEFTLSRKDPGYVDRARQAQELERQRRLGQMPPELAALLERIGQYAGQTHAASTGLGSLVFAVKPGDGSAREQAASSQKMLGGEANVAVEYATKRYRSNLINWGMLPFIIAPCDQARFHVGDWLYIPGIRTALREGATSVSARLIRSGEELQHIMLQLPGLCTEDRKIILAGCLMNYYAQQ